MNNTLGFDWMAAAQDERITKAVKQERARLRSFIRKRVPDSAEAEDILQDVFYELVEAYRLMKPIERVSAWLFRVARNRITDLFRKKRPEALAVASGSLSGTADSEPFLLEDLLPSPDAGPEALYARGVLLDEINAALDELPNEQREVFVAHEIEGRSFKEISAATGIGLNTLLSRKRYAILQLRERLQSIYDQFVKT